MLETRESNDNADLDVESPIVEESVARIEEGVTPINCAIKGNETLTTT